jgi:hypothetical protein
MENKKKISFYCVRLHVYLVSHIKFLVTYCQNTWSFKIWTAHPRLKTDPTLNPYWYAREIHYNLGRVCVCARTRARVYKTYVPHKLLPNKHNTLLTE